MNISDFDYKIENGLIAQHPLAERDASRLLVLDREKGTISHRSFRDIVEYLNPGDILVLNDTRVIPARIKALKPSGAAVEILLVRELGPNLWEILVKGVTKGMLSLSGGITAEISRFDGALAARFRPESGSTIKDTEIKEHLFRSGVAPLPFYIKREADPSDTERYQTVYAEKEGAIAAPTAGLHFTDEILASLKARGVEIRTVTLHVGYGTFRPVTADNIKEHVMDEEFYEVPQETAESVNRAAAEGRRVIAVGTTVTRTLESASDDDGRLKAGTGKASIFIYPGYKFKVIGSLITNFHQPRSTPMMLTSAFSGLDLLKKAYSESLKEGYRLFSYGDSMIIL